LEGARVGWYSVSGYLPLDGGHGEPALISGQITNASRLLDVARLQVSVGKVVVIRGPGPMAGVLRSFEVDEEDVAWFTIDPAGRQ
jgi:hypothetical protein